MTTWDAENMTRGRARQGTSRALTLSGLPVVLCVFGALGCDSGKDKGSTKSGDPAANEQAIRKEVERRLAEERPRMEERLRAELGQKPRGADPGARPATAVEPVEPGVDPARDPAARPDPSLDPAARPDPSGVPREGPQGAAESAPRPVEGPLALPPGLVQEKAPDEDPQGLMINQVVLAKRLAERKPEDTGTAFTLEDERVYCHVDAKNPKGPERMLTVVWHHRGREFHRLRLRVGVGHVWRTWAYLSIKPTHSGNWRCSVLNEEGKLIRGVDFTISK